MQSTLILLIFGSIIELSFQTPSYDLTKMELVPKTIIDVLAFQKVVFQMPAAMFFSAQNHHLVKWISISSRPMLVVKTNGLLQDYLLMARWQMQL
jgi:hypothetical protein